jgi:DNA-binding response OmpR family regulator
MGATPFPSDDPEVARLRAEHEALKASIIDRQTLTPDAWGLTPQEQTIFGCLIKKEEVAKGTILTLLYGKIDEGKSRLLDAFMAKIRRKTRPHGVEIRTIHGFGYRLADRAAWAKALKLNPQSQH